MGAQGPKAALALPGGKIAGSPMGDLYRALLVTGLKMFCSEHACIAAFSDTQNATLSS
jgi:hypothetical protein